MIRRTDWLALFASALFSCVALLGLLLLLTSCGGDAFTTELDGHVSANAGSGGSAGSGGIGGEGGSPAATCPGLPGVRPPPGTIASSSPAFADANAPVLALDCDIRTAWEVAASEGSLTLSFPSPVHISALSIVGGSSPPGASTFAIYGSTADGAETVSIGTSVRATGSDFAMLSPIAVTEGAYTSIRIDLTAPPPSWAAIAEVTVIP